MTSFDSWESELYHDGQKGMRWGRRRYQYEDGSLTPLGKIRYGTADNYNRLKNRKSIKKMTDEELQKYNARLRLEKETRGLKSGGHSLIKGVSDFVSNMQKRADEKRDYELRKEENRIRLIESQNSVARAKEQSKIAKSNADQAAAQASEYKTRAKRIEMRAKKKESKATVINAKSERRKLRTMSRIMDLISGRQKGMFDHRNNLDAIAKTRAETTLQSFRNVSAAEATNKARADAIQAAYNSEKARYDSEAARYRAMSGSSNNKKKNKKNKQNDE